MHRRASPRDADEHCEVSFCALFSHHSYHLSHFEQLWHSKQALTVSHTPEQVHSRRCTVVEKVMYGTGLAGSHAYTELTAVSWPAGRAQRRHKQKTECIW
jgi:hypothetical protein